MQRGSRRVTESKPFQNPIRRLPGKVAYLLTVVVVLAVGVAVCVYLIKTKPTAEGKPKPDPGRLVSAFRAEKASHRVAINVYGTARASQQWTAIAEVAGQTVEVDSRFEPGELLPAGRLLVQIDPIDYDLAVKRLEAEAAARDIQLDELDQEKANFEEILKLHQRRLQLAEAERDRLLDAFAKQAVSRSALELAEGAYEARRTAVQETLNGLKLLPMKRQLAEKQKDVAAIRLQEARRARGKCAIRLPFAARCASKAIEVNQFVTAGQQLGVFLALDSAEVVAMVETRKMPLLFPEGIKALGVLDLPQMDLSESLMEKLRIPAKVSWGIGDLEPVWYGMVSRIGSSLDPGTRTVPVVIEVRDPYKNVQPGVRPPLIPDAFCDVTFYGATFDDVVVIPRDSLHDGKVYLSRDGKLHIRPVTVAALEEQLAVISEGIESGDIVITADLFPANEGMPVRVEMIDNPVQARVEIDAPARELEADAEAGL